jgi:hypothetical protein
MDDALNLADKIQNDAKRTSKKSGIKARSLSANRARQMNDHFFFVKFCLMLKIVLLISSISIKT